MPKFFVRWKRLRSSKRQAVIETVAGGNEFLDFSARRIRSQAIERRERDLNWSSRGETVEIEGGNAHARLVKAATRVGAGRIKRAGQRRGWRD